MSVSYASIFQKVIPVCSGTIKYIKSSNKFKILDKSL